MFMRAAVLGTLALSAVEAFCPLSSVGLQLRQSHGCGLSSLRMVNEDRRDGFGGGKDAIKDVIEKRAKSDWGEGYGGSKGDVYKGPSSFEEYLKKRAAESGGSVKDAAGNDITNSKPSYTVAEGTWGADPGTVKDADPLAWIDKSVAGFEKQDTSWLKEDSDVDAWRTKREQEKKAQEAEVEARMAKWMAEAAAKKAAEGQ